MIQTIIILLSLTLWTPRALPNLSMIKSLQVMPFCHAVTTNVVLAKTLGACGAPKATRLAIKSATHPALSHLLIKLITTRTLPPLLTWLHRGHGGIYCSGCVDNKRLHSGCMWGCCHGILSNRCCTWRFYGGKCFTHCGDIIGSKTVQP